MKTTGQNHKKGTRLTMYALIGSLFFITPLIEAKPTYRDYQLKGSGQIRILERLYEKYSFNPSNEEAFIRIIDDWRSALSQYERSTGAERSPLLRDIAKQYNKIQAAGKVACEVLDQYSTDLLNDFSDRVKNSKPKSLEKDDYVVQVKVAKGEFYRGSELCKRGQFAPGAHIYDRGINVLVKRYQVLQWPLPKELFYKTDSSVPNKSAEK